MVKQPDLRARVLVSASTRYQRNPITLLSAAVSLLLVGMAFVIHIGESNAAIIQRLYLPILVAVIFLEMQSAFLTTLFSAMFFAPQGGPWKAGPLFIWLLRLHVFTMGRVPRIFDHRSGEKRSQRFSGTYVRILSSLANTVEVRDHHTQGHCERVAENALVMGRALGFDNARLELLYWSAMLHDLGKISVPEHILVKQGGLTDPEFQEIRKHPTYGADLLVSVSAAFTELAGNVRSHHERWDGRGYPHRLGGREIPLMARIIAVVDVFEALTSKRPYRSPMAPVEAVKYIASGAGTQFDPDLVTIFHELYDRGEIQYPIKIEVAGETENVERMASSKRSQVIHTSA